jgi:hypothetical protein
MWSVLVNVLCEVEKKIYLLLLVKNSVSVNSIKLIDSVIHIIYIFTDPLLA